ncbi:Phosphoinositide phospholipase c [Thalictrum thalictroides]|uniref:Phosphoinositide phospholipase c n=1 Tax=Thalictrum thalictroides TaxID=46969 RepID=A0A7J6WTW1_THATH|nr:Phosphoinositide phospholipase c [Thalictrum thalictroides]
MIQPKKKPGERKSQILNPKLKRKTSEPLEKAITYGIGIVRFPKGTRFHSSNYNPHIGWMHGDRWSLLICRAPIFVFAMAGIRPIIMVDALDVQIQWGVWIHGKPEFLLNSKDNEVFNPTASLPAKKILKDGIWIFNIQFNAYSPPDFYARNGIAGVPADSLMKKT